jgi:hypothetical protein
MYLKLLEIMKNDLFYIAINLYGTRVIQKILVSKIPEIQKITCNYIKYYVLELFMNPNSIHIIGKIVSDLPQYSSFIYECILNNMIKISVDKNGCYIIQKCMEKSTDIKKYMIITLQNYMLFMTDQFANYVTQFLIALNDQIYINELICLIKPNLMTLAKQKFSANVIEKVIYHNNSYLYMEMITISSK